MEEPSRVSFRDSRFASRRAEEAACRRFQAAAWLEAMVGPLRMSVQPSEQEFISCLRSGIVLCNAINRIQPGAVAKVVANQSAGPALEIQPLAAYQYFENIRNFLVAVEELKLPSFEASDLERDTLEAGSAAKIVDCILALKTFYEWKQNSGESGPWKHMKSPLAPQSASRIQTNGTPLVPLIRRLDLSGNPEKQQPVQNDDQKSEDKVDSLVRALSDCMFDSKENIDQGLLDSWRHKKTDSARLFGKIMSSCLQDQESRSILKDLFTEGSTRLDKLSAIQPPKSRSILEELFVEGSTQLDNLTAIQHQKSCNLCMHREGGCNHRKLLEDQENELAELKALLMRTREELVTLQSQLQNDLIQLETQTQMLSSAALGYHHAIKENRLLYNMLQELKGNIRVFCRIRPSFHSDASSSIDYIGKDGSLMIIDPLKPQSTRKTFQFNKVFGPIASQEEVYKDTQALVRSVMDGYNVCIFAYGQTGSGKTHTMCGPLCGPAKDMGINHLALNDLFEISCTRTDVKYEIHIQMVEIYNEQVRDLFSEDTSTTKLEIRNCSGNSGLTLPNAHMHQVKSTADVLDLMKVGEQNRASSSTAMNNRSSRSHSVLTVHVHGKDVSGNMLRSCLHLVDLAGSERVDKSEVTGDRLKEAQHINKSLACLGDVISALAQKNAHIPYRNSKLTQLLQNSLGGNAKMLMFAHVSPEADSYGETLSTLKFAQRASTVELGAAHVNKESTEVRQLKEEIDNLKKTLASKEGERMASSQILERTKYTTERTPPRTRRLSIENSSARRHIGTIANPDDRKALNLKSPVARPKFATESAPIRTRRLSLEGNRNEKGQQESSTIHGTPDIPNGALKENIEDVFEVKPRSACNKVVPAEESFRLSPSSCNSSRPSQVLKLENSFYRRVPLQQPKFDEVAMTPDAYNKSKRSLNADTGSNKGSQIRKSLLTIGKFINGSERRANQYQSEITPTAKHGTDNYILKSPITPFARSQRRQSLTNVQALGSGTSRRSSLGGKSTDAYLADIQSARAKSPPPQPIHSSAVKVTKRWL